MEKHILLVDQVEHLRKCKAINSTAEEIESFIANVPYEMTIQQVKLFFKKSNSMYQSLPIEDWENKYNDLCDDSHIVFHKIIEIENKLKNELFIATYKNDEWIQKYDSYVDIGKDNEYYKKVNSTSMGNIIRAYKVYYESTGINILPYNKQCEIFNFINLKEDDFNRIRGGNVPIYIENTFKQKLKDQAITILEIERIEMQIKNEIKNWIKESIENSEDFYARECIPVILTSVVSKTMCDKKIFNSNSNASTTSKQNDELMVELIGCYKKHGIEYKNSKRKQLNKITNNIYGLIEEKLQIELGNIYSYPESPQSKAWVNYFKENELDLDDVPVWLKKSHLTDEIQRGAKFNSTNKLLIAYKVFRDQVAHGRTIMEPLKTPNDILFKKLVLNNLITKELNINVEEYLKICDYWNK